MSDQRGGRRLRDAVDSARVRGIALVQHELGKRDRLISRARFHEENAIDLRALLAEPIERDKGSFVVLQVGANDGVADDPIRDAVLSRGWTLYAVEPMPAAYGRLVANYRTSAAVHPINCAVGHDEGVQDLFFLDQPHRGESYEVFSSFSRAVVEKHRRAVNDPGATVASRAVATHTISSLVETFDIPPVDMLQVDTEGFDYEVLSMAFSAGVVPAIVAFEWTHLSREERWCCRSDLLDHGYRWLLDKGDVIATRQVPPAARTS